MTQSVNGNKPSATKFASELDLDFHSLGAGQELVYAPQSRISRVVPAQNARLLQRLKGFATLEEHTFLLCKQMNLAPQRAEPLKQQLAAVLDQHKEFILTHEQLLHQLTQGQSESEQPPAIASLGVPTRNRPGALRRCLETFSESAARFGNQVDLFIMDGSDDASAAQANEEAARSIKRRFGRKVSYINKAGVDSFAAQLAKVADLPREIVDFAVTNPESCPIDTGANRNVLLLATIGEMTVQVDDDTACEIIACPQPQDKLTLTSDSLPSERWFFPESEARLAGNQALNFFALHQELLGCSLSNVINAWSENEIDLNNVRLSFLDRSGYPAGRVLVTSIGIAGDCGTGSPFFSLLRLDGTSRARLLESEAIYRQSMVSHRQIRCVSSVTVGDHARVSGINLGLDNRRFLPPFTSVGRSQDTNFSSLLFCSGAGYFGHLPYSLMHDRPVGLKDDMRKTATQTLSGKILTLLIHRFVPMRHKSPEDNLIALGEDLIELGSLPQEFFEEIVKYEVWRLLLSRIRTLESLLVEFKRQPQYWADDVQHFLAASREAMANPHLHYPADLVAAVGTEQAGQWLQRIVLRQGQVLKAWSQIRDAALQLRQKETMGANEI